VQDTTAPAINQANIAVVATNLAGNIVDFSVPVVDAGDASPTVIVNPPSGSLFPVGTTTVNVTAYDFSHNTNTTSFTVTVLGPPVITTPGNIVVEVTNFATGNIVNYNVSVNDFLDPSPTLIVNPPSGSVFPVGVTTVNVTAYDSGHHTNTA